MVFDKKTLRNIFLVASGCIFIYWVLHETERFNSVFGVVKDIVSPFVLGSGLAFVINVPMRGIERMLSFIKNSELRRGIAILLTILLFILVLTLVFWLLIPQIGDTVELLASRLPGFFASTQEAITTFFADNPDVLEWINANLTFDHAQIAGIIEEALNRVTNSVSTILTGAVSAIGTITSLLFNAIISIVFAVYCLARKEILARQGKRLLYAILPERISDYILRVMRLSNTTFSYFLSGQCVEVCILGCLFAVSMAIFKMPYIPLVSVLVAVTAFIPLVGAFVGCALGAFFIMVNDPMQAVWFVIMFLVLQQIEGNLIYPKVVGAHIGLPGMWVLFAVAVGGELMGVSGMFLMIPMASVVYTLLGEFATNRLALKGISPEKYNDPVPMEESTSCVDASGEDAEEKADLENKA